MRQRDPHRLIARFTPTIDADRVGVVVVRADLWTDEEYSMSGYPSTHPPTALEHVTQHFWDWHRAIEALKVEPRLPL